LVYNKIIFIKTDFNDLTIPVDNAAILINPPYGERLKEENLNELYSMIGSRLKHHFTGNSAWILSSSLESMKFIGLKPSSKMDLFNGSLRCKFNNYRLFKGKLNK
jgi:putative N6-adenine-specific DNA methylase